MNAAAPEHHRLDELIAELERSRADLLQAIDETPEALRRERSRDDGWTVSQILEHLALVEDGSGRLVGRLLRDVRAQAVPEERAESVMNALDRFSLPTPRRKVAAPEFTVPTEGLSVEQSIARLQQSRARLLGALHTVRGYALDVAHAPHPLMGALDVYGWLLATAQHEQRHTYQIRQLANQEFGA